MLHRETKRPLTLSQGREELIKKRKPEKVVATLEDEGEFQLFKKGEHAWKLAELPEERAYLMLDFTPHACKVNSFVFMCFECI
jgi:hypothetical protein